MTLEEELGHVTSHYESEPFSAISESSSSQTLQRCISLPNLKDVEKVFRESTRSTNSLVIDSDRQMMETIQERDGLLLELVKLRKMNKNLLSTLENFNKCKEKIFNALSDEKVKETLKKAKEDGSTRQLAKQFKLLLDEKEDQLKVQKIKYEEICAELEKKEKEVNNFREECMKNGIGEDAEACILMLEAKLEEKEKEIGIIRHTYSKKVLEETDAKARIEILEADLERKAKETDIICDKCSKKDVTDNHVKAYTDKKIQEAEGSKTDVPTENMEVRIEMLEAELAKNEDDLEFIRNENKINETADESMKTRIQMLEAELVKKEEEIYFSRNECRIHKTAKENLKARIGTIEAELAKREEEIDFIGRESSVKETENQDLKAQIDILEAELVKKREEIDFMCSESTIQETEKEGMKAQIDMLEAELVKKEEDIDFIGRECMMKETEQEDINARIHMLEAELLTKEEEVDFLRNECTIKGIMEEDLKANINMLEAKLVRKDEEIDILRSECTIKDIAEGDWKAHSSMLEAELEKKLDITSNECMVEENPKARIIKLEAELVKKEEEVDILRTECAMKDIAEENAEARIIMLEAELVKEEEEVDTLRHECTLKSMTEDDTKAYINMLTAEIKKEAEERDVCNECTMKCGAEEDTKACIDILEAKLTKKEEELDSIRNECVRQGMVEEDAKARIESLEAELGERENELYIIRNECMQKGMANEDAKARIESLEAEVKKREEEVHVVNGALEDTKARIELLEAELENRNEEGNTANDEWEETKEYIDALEAKLEKKDKELFAAYDECDEAEARAYILENELAKKEAEVAAMYDECKKIGLMAENTNATIENLKAELKKREIEVDGIYDECAKKMDDAEKTADVRIKLLEVELAKKGDEVDAIRDECVRKSKLEQDATARVKMLEIQLEAAKDKSISEQRAAKDFQVELVQRERELEDLKKELGIAYESLKEAEELIKKHNEDAAIASKEEKTVSNEMNECFQVELKKLRESLDRVKLGMKMQILEKLDSTFESIEAQKSSVKAIENVSSVVHESIAELQNSEESNDTSQPDCNEADSELLTQQKSQEQTHFITEPQISSDFWDQSPPRYHETNTNTSSYDKISETQLRKIESELSCVSFQCLTDVKQESGKENRLVLRTQEDSFLCSSCSPLFMEKSSLKTPMKSLSDENPFKCACCSASFKFKFQLESHDLMHSQTWLAKSTQKNALKARLKLHSGKKLFKNSSTKKPATVTTRGSTWPEDEYDSSPIFLKSSRVSRVVSSSAEKTPLIHKSSKLSIKSGNVKSSSGKSLLLKSPRVVLTPLQLPGKSTSSKSSSNGQRSQQPKKRQFSPDLRRSKRPKEEQQLPDLRRSRRPKKERNYYTPSP